MGGLVADGTVGGVGNNLGGVLDEVDVRHRGGTVQYPLDEDRQLAQPHPAGHALAAGLGVAQPQEVQGHIPGWLALIRRSMSLVGPFSTVWARPGVSMDNRLMEIPSNRLKFHDSAAGGNGLDLHQSALGQTLDRKSGPGGARAGEVFGIHAVHRAKVPDVRQQDGGLDHIFQT